MASGVNISAKRGKTLIVAKKFAVYYRTVPDALETFIKKDGHISVSKDGVNRGVGHACPRMTLIMESVKLDASDKERIKKLEDLLDRLCQNNQLVSYS
jgi:hypothetical protein